MDKESAVAELKSRLAVLAGNVERAREGRRLVVAGISRNEYDDRIAGCEEQKTAERHAAYLQQQVDEANEKVETLHAAYLSARTERHQVQTLIEQIETSDKQEANRREQQGLDDWYRTQTGHPAK
ncbi:MAG: hypothetical protein P4L40_20340 [Terracidiphilus sp.]|nr:hypothetical protein [Terracidiphilus sp.]